MVARAFSLVHIGERIIQCFWGNNVTQFIAYEDFDSEERSVPDRVVKFWPNFYPRDCKRTLFEVGSPPSNLSSIGIRFCNGARCLLSQVIRVLQWISFSFIFGEWVEPPVFALSLVFLAVLTVEGVAGWIIRIQIRALRGID